MGSFLLTGFIIFGLYILLFRWVVTIAKPEIRIHEKADEHVPIIKRNVAIPQVVNDSIDQIRNQIPWTFYKSSEVIRHGRRCFFEGKLMPEELNVIHLLTKNLDHKDYFIFNNLIIPSKTLGTTQIDHVVVSKYGIFVIENKGNSGWIFANKHHKKWTQTLPGGSKHPFQNPILQNFAHICALKEQLHFIKDQMLFNVVVFSDQTTFKTDRPDGVIQQHELIDYILSKQKPVLKEVELLVVIGKLSMLCQSVEVTHEEHAEATIVRLTAKQASVV